MLRLFLGSFVAPERMSLLICLAAMSSLAGCATLPASGPTAGEVSRAAHRPENGIGYKIVPITPDLLPTAGAVPDTKLDSLLSLSAPAPASDRIQVGDQLSVTIYEVGVSLFGAPTALGTAQTLPASPIANVTRTTVLVNEEGAVSLPYVGQVIVAGRLPSDVQATIERRLRPMSQSPQVLVSVAESVGNVAYALGSFAKPGRYRLSAAHERLLDLVALAGGSPLDQNDAEVRVVRGQKVGVARLGDVRAEDNSNLVLQPGDRVTLVSRPRTYTVFGAVDRVSQVPFAAARVSLAEAIARVGGPSENRANPKAVFLFRYIDDGDTPTIYRVNLKDPQAYFICQRFYIRDKDVIYFSNSASNPPAKLINLINQLFSPLVTARILTN